MSQKARADLPSRPTPEEEAHQPAPDDHTQSFPCPECRSPVLSLAEVAVCCHYCSRFVCTRCATTHHHFEVCKSCATQAHNYLACTHTE
jgi:hypothetical protein